MLKKITVKLNFRARSRKGSGPWGQGSGLWPKNPDVLAKTQRPGCSLFPGWRGEDDHEAPLQGTESTGHRGPVLASAGESMSEGPRPSSSGVSACLSL